MLFINNMIIFSNDDSNVFTHLSFFKKTQMLSYFPSHSLYKQHQNNQFHQSTTLLLENMKLQTFHTLVSNYVISF